MIAPRSASLIVDQAAISAIDRPQLMQSADRGSTTQTLTHGVEMADGGMSSIYAAGRQARSPHQAAISAHC